MRIRESRRQREARPQQPLSSGYTDDGMQSRAIVEAKGDMLDRLVTDIGGKAKDGASIRHAV